MKFFHLSDLHIGLRLFNRDLKEDQEYILKQIADLVNSYQANRLCLFGSKGDHRPDSLSQ